MIFQDVLPLLLVALVAFLYASVGHGGASGYLALMAILGMQPLFMRPSALILNVFVSLVSFSQFYRAGFFRWPLFWPFALASVPLSFVGATLPISDSLYKKLLAVALLVAVARMVFQNTKQPTRVFFGEYKLPISLLVGAVIGLLSGMLGIGGGIILTPVLLLLGWANLKEVAAVSALFIFTNSVAGFAGLLTKGYTPVPLTFWWLGAALIGGLAGAYYGSQKYNLPTLRYALTAGLLIAIGKLFFT